MVEERIATKKEVEEIVKLKYNNASNHISNWICGEVGVCDFSETGMHAHVENTANHSINGEYPLNGIKDLDGKWLIREDGESWIVCFQPNRYDPENNKYCFHNEVV